MTSSSSTTLQTPHLKPSTSPSSTRRHKKRDSAFEFAEITSQDFDLKQDESSSQSTDQPDSLLVRLIVTPLLMLSFLLSLCYVDRRDRARRSSEHAGGSNSFWSRLRIREWLDPQPYQDPKDSTWGDARDAGGAKGDVQVPAPAWVHRKKHRKLAGMEIKDAFAVRGKVMTAMGVWAVLAVVFLAWMIRKVYGWLM